MGNLHRMGSAWLGALLVLAACNPQDQLGIGVSEENIPDSTDPTFSGFTFFDGKLLISKAINRDLFGESGSHYCFDNVDTKYGCRWDGSDPQLSPKNRKPVFLRSIQISLFDRSKMFGLAESDELTVLFPGATVTTAIPSLNPDTGDFVYTRREKWRYTPTNTTPPYNFAAQQIVSSTDSTCVPGINGAEGFDDRPGYALSGLHVFEEGIDYTTSISGLLAAKVDLSFYRMTDENGVLTASTDLPKTTVTGYPDPEKFVPGVGLIAGPVLAANDTNPRQDGQMPRVITGFCLRSAKKSTDKMLIRVGLFGVRGVFFKSRFR